MISHLGSLAARLGLLVPKVGRTIVGCAVKSGAGGIQLPLALFAKLLPSGARLAWALVLALRTLIATPKYAATTVVVAVIGFVSLSALTNPYMTEELAYAHTRSSAIELVDADGRWLGIVPPANFEDWSDGRILPADHEALPIGEIPQGWRACIVYLEDREFDGVSRALGIDPFAIIKSGLQTLSGDRRRGASTLYMQVVRTLRGQTPDHRERWAQLAFRKVAELLGANALVQALRNDPQGAERFVAMHLPLVIGASGSGFGSPVHGIGLASRMLFGVPSYALTLEQQVVLAAAVKAPILLALPSDRRGQARAQERWKRVKERADFCLRHAPGIDSEAVEKARAALAAMATPTPHIDPALRPLLPADEKLAWRIAASPSRRAVYFAKHELRVLKHELDAAVGQAWRSRVATVTLSTSAPESRAFVNNFSNELGALEQKLPGLSLGLTEKALPERQANVVAACADENGKLRRIYTSHQGLYWSRKSPLGSVAKIAAAVALGRRDTPATGYCRAPMPGFPQLTEGKHCSSPGAWLSARDAIARSDNYAVNWALRNRASKSDLIDVASVLQLPLGDVPPSTALTFGTFELTPAEMMRLAGMVGGGLSGARQSHALPSVVKALTIVEPGGRLVRSVIGPMGVVEAKAVSRLFTPQVRSYVASVLEATSGDGGTLRRLKIVRKRIGVRLYAKTGTVSTAGVTRALHVLGIAADDAASSSLLVSISAPSDGRPLGTRLTASALSPAVAAVLCRSGPLEELRLGEEPS